MNPFPLANDQPIEPPQPKLESWYYREIWPRVVNQAFDRGWRMFAGIESKTTIDGKPATVVNRGRELTRSEALAYRGTTITLSQADGIIPAENKERGDTWQQSSF